MTSSEQPATAWFEFLSVARYSAVALELQSSVVRGAHRRSKKLDEDVTELRRELGVFQAMMLGLGAIVGTGVFVSIGIAAGVTGPAVVLAVAAGCVVAVCNGLSSAQLAASHPVSGGTYEYGYRWLNPAAGFLAGWMFLCAKSASAATAALGFSAYLLAVVGQESGDLHIPVAIAAVVVLSALILQGIRRTSLVNTIIVGMTLVSLLTMVIGVLPDLSVTAKTAWRPLFVPLDGLSTWGAFGQACALMFVAFTGYGRIATMGEEVRDPARTIPRAMIATLVVSSLLYMVVAVTAVGTIGAEALAAATADGTAPLLAVAAASEIAGVEILMTAGAITAMLGVLLNLVLGLSRVVLAMGRRCDLPAGLAHVTETTGTPAGAVTAVSAVIIGLVCLGDVRLTWSFSALTVLIYYSLTNLAALQLTGSQQLYPRLFSWLGLILCLLLSLHMDSQVWIAGGVCLIVGFLVRLISRRAGSGSPENQA